MAEINTTHGSHVRGPFQTERPVRPACTTSTTRVTFAFLGVVQLLQHLMADDPRYLLLFEDLQLQPLFLLETFAIKLLHLCHSGDGSWVLFISGDIGLTFIAATFVPYHLN